MADTIASALVPVKDSWADGTDSDEEVCNSKSEHKETGDGSLPSSIPVIEEKEEAKSGGDKPTEVEKSQIESIITKPLSPTGEGSAGNGGDGTARSEDNGGLLEVGRIDKYKYEN